MSLLDRIVADRYDAFLAPAERAGIAAMRHDLIGELRGNVLEIGAGTGLNLGHYPAQMASLTLTEPTPEMARHLRERVAKLRPGTTVLDAPAHDLPLDDDSIDTVVSTLVLCTVPDVEAALAEITRVLRPGGSLVVLEHVATDNNWRHVQRFLNPAWKVFARGCNLTRDTKSLLADAGFDVNEIVESGMPGLPWTKASIRGTATLA
jgi:ubiquinone/menaquinone biosynthesis C-methylase UbiE